MFNWAQSTFDKLSQTVAPPPEDGPGRFAYCVQRGEEDAAMGCIASMDPVHTVVNQSKGQYPIHLACQYSSMRLVQLLLNQPGMNVGQTDLSGNTPLHYASMSTAPNGLEVVKLLVGTYGASVLIKNKNGQGQMPYDVATKNAIRQYLLPIQLQAETQIALDNGGQGLPPGIDMGGFRINNSAMPPPPTFGGGPATPGGQHPPMMGGAAPGMPPAGAASPAMPNVPAPHMFGTPSPSHHAGSAVSAPVPAAVAAAQPSPAPDSRGKSHGYSRVGSSSAVMSGVGKYRADGFHSSSSDVSLQRKYGHASTSNYGRTIAPPPSSGNASVAAALAANANGATPPNLASGGGANPFSAGGAGAVPGRYGALNGRSRYVNYGPVATPAQAAPAYGAFPATAAPVGGNVSTFTPGGAVSAAANPTTTSSPYGAPAAVTQSAPTSAGTSSYGAAAPSTTPTTPYMPPPPYQSHNYVAPNSANIADANAGDIFAAPSPQKTAPAPSPEPAVAAAAAAAVATTLATPAATSSSEPSAAAPGAATSEATLAENWVEAVDPSSGQTYYYNAATNETSWEKPAAALSSGGVALAANWVETMDPNSGQVYYYNSFTHETSWEKPLASSTAATESSTITSPVEHQLSQPAATIEETTVTEMPAAYSASDAFASSAATTTTTEATMPASVADAFGAPPPSETETAAPTAEVATESSSAPADAFSAPPSSETTTATPTTEVATESSTPTPTPTPAPISASDAFSAPPPSAADAFGAPPPSDTTTATPTTTATGTTSSPFFAPRQRSISADELFAENPPASSATGHENDTTTPATATPQKAEPTTSVEEIDDGDEDMMDDVPLSPTLQRPVSSAPTADTGVPSLDTQPNNPTPAPDGGAESLFAAIGMPPPPFSARKV
jgi:hypothetical protein